MGRALTMLLASLFATGCQPDKPAPLCTRYPAQCQDLVADSWCRHEREQLIGARVGWLEQVNAHAQYTLMRTLEEYLTCAKRATGVEYKQQNGRHSAQVESMLAASAQLSELEQASKQSQDPFLLLWHWRHYHDEAARTAFLAQEGQASLQHPELQLALAGIYSKALPRKAIAILHYGLSLYPAGATIDGHFLTSLTQLYAQLDLPHHSYLWNVVHDHFYPSTQSGLNLASRYQLGNQQAELDAQAAAIIEALKLGQYRAVEVIHGAP